MVVFPSKKSILLIVLLGAMAVLLPLPLLLCIGEVDLKTGVFLSVLLFGFSGLMLWILFDTSYKLDGKLLYFASGPFRGKIDVASIRRIEYDKKWMKTSLYRPALDRDGLTVYYDKYEDIFFSPKDKESFIAALKAINPGIEVC